RPGNLRRAPDVENPAALGERDAADQTAAAAGDESESTMSDAPYLSLVIPAYNEQENIPVLMERVGAALTQTGRPFEVLIVDDGSSDSTPKLLAEGMQK